MTITAMLQKENDALRERVSELENQLARQQQIELALQENEARLHSVLNNLTDAPYRRNLRTDSYDYLSPVITQLTGRTVEEMNQAGLETVLSWIHPDDVPQVQAEIERTHTLCCEVGRATGRLEYRFQTKAGDYCWLGDYLTVVAGEDGQPLYLLGVVRDITERNQAEKQLHIALEKYRVLFETFPLGISITDATGNLIEVNRESERLLGISSEDHTQRTYDGPEWHIVRPDGTPMPTDEYASVQALKEERLVENVEMGIVKDDGEITWLNVTAAPIPLEGYGVAIAYGNITERKRAEDKLLYQASLMQNVSDAIIASDLDFRITSWNQAAEIIYGWSAAEAIGKSVTDLLLTTYAVETREQVRQQFMSQGFWQGEASQKRKDGSPVTVLASVSLIKDSTGKSIGAVAVNRDISERKQMEAERQANLHFFASMDRVNRAIQEAHDLERMMSDVLDVVLSIFDCDRAFLLHPCDPAAARWRVPMERTKPEYPGALAVGLEMPMDPDVAKTFRLLLAADGPVKFGPGTPYSLPAGVSDQFGFKCFMSMALYPKIGQPWQFGLHQCAYARIWTADEERLFQGIGRRLTDALTSLLQYHDLRDSERRLVEAQRIAHIGYWERDLAAGRMILSDEACRIFGLAPEDFPLNLEQWHQRWLELIHPEDRERTAHAAAEAVRDGPLYNVEYRIIRPSGEVRFIHSEAVVNRDGSGRTHSMLGMMQDITERKQAEEAQVKLEEQLRQAQKMESIGRLAGGVAHDFNNLLTVILGYSELMQARLPLNSTSLEQVGQIRQAAKRAENLTRQLLAFSRKQMLVPEVFDLNELVTNLRKMLERLIGEDILLITVLQPDLWPVKADPGQIEQVIMNLAVNARDAMPTGGRLTIETVNFSDGDPFTKVLGSPGVRLTVTDTGYGIDQEVQAHIFEPFFTTKEQGKGTGLGLATVYGIIKQSGGEITLDSQPGQGAAFALYLPAYKTDWSGSTAPQPEPAAQSGRETILLVEDEPGVRNLVRVTLHNYSYTLLEANHGYQALALAQQEKSIDLLLTDVVMPQMDGRELAERLRVLHPQIKVLFISGYTDDEIIRRGLKTAAVEFLPKPFSPVALAAKVREVLDK